LVTDELKISAWTVLSVVSLLSAPISASVGACNFNSTELRVTMSGLHPIIKARINGTEVGLIVDSGAFYSFLSPSTASQLKLALSRRASWFLRAPAATTPMFSAFFKHARDGNFRNSAERMRAKRH
jgi:hypothetical protein